MERDRQLPGAPARIAWIVLLETLAVAAGLLLLWKLRTIVSWVLVALFLALAFQPAMTWLTRHRFKRGWAVLTLFAVVAGVVVTMVATLAPLVVDQGRELLARAPELIERIEESKPVKWADRRFHVLDRVQDALRGGAGDVAEPALAVASGVLHGVVATVTVTTLTIFMLLFGDEVLEKGLAWLRPRRREHWRMLAGRMRKAVGGYVAGTFLVALVGGVVMGTTLAILGVPYFLPLGLLMVILGIVPFLGSALGAVVLVAVTFASSGTKSGLIFAAVYLVYQQVENEVLQPLVQRHTLKMNPLLITLALLAGTGLAGVLGTLLALPVAGAVQVVLQDALERRQARFEAASVLVAPGEAPRAAGPPEQGGPG